MRAWTRWVLLLSLGPLGACGEPPSEGGLGEPCRTDGTCNTPYLCVSGACAEPSVDDAGAVQDGGQSPADGGAPADGSAATDGGASDGGSASDGGGACGDGVLGPTETCDPGVPAGEPGACPSSCDDSIPCTADAPVGSPCDAQCEHTAVTVCANADGCCAEGCRSVDDDDCPSWDPAVQVGTTSSSGRPVVGMGGGVTSVGWITSDGRTQGRGVRHVEGSGWGVSAVLAGGVASNDVFRPESTVVDPGGNATVLGQGTAVGSIQRVTRAVRGEAGAAWAPAQSLGPEYGSISSEQMVPVVGVAPRDGLTVAFWMEGANVAAVEHAAGAWGAPARLTGTLPATEEAPSVARLDSTSAVITWANRWDVWAVRYVYGSGFSSVTRLSSGEVDIEHEPPSVGANERGEAVVAWVEIGDVPRVMAARYAAGEWSTARPLHTSSLGAGHASGARAMVGPSGRALVVWREELGLWARELADGAWSTTARVDDGTAIVESIDAAVDEAGNSYVVWERRESPVRTEGITLAIHRPGLGWTTTTEAMAPRSVINFFGLDPRVATAGGVTTVVWSQSGAGEDAIWARRLR